MKIIVDENEIYESVEITIKCPKVDHHVNQLIDQIRTYELSFQGKKDNRIYAIQAEQLFYIESIENKTFLYTEDNIFESSLKLYEFEEVTIANHLIRISKNLIVNTSKINNVRALFNGKFEATLVNGEKVIVNRHYVKAFKASFLRS